MGIEIATFQDLLRLEARLKQIWQPRNDLIEEMRRLRFMEVRPEVPEEIEPEEVITPFSFQLVQRMVGTLTADPVGVTVPAAGEGDEDVERASKIEKFLSAALDQLAKQADDDVLERFVECLIADGHGCMRVLWAPQLWRGYPRRRRDQPESEYNKQAELWKRGRPLPISWAWVDPLNVYPIWSEFGLEAVLEVDQRDLLSLRPESYNLVSKGGKVIPELWDFARVKGEEGSLTFRQLWTRDKLIYAVEDRIVHVEAHGYGAPPYVYAMGDAVSTRDPGKMGLSMLFPLRYLQPYFDRLLSQKGTAIRFFCWPTLVYEQAEPQTALGDDASLAEEANQLQIRPGKILPILQGERLYFLTWQGSGPDIDRQIAMVKGLMDQAGLPGVMYGDPGGTDTGYAINQLIAAARMKFKPTVAHAQRALEQVLGIILDIIEYKAKQTLYVYAPGPRGKKGGWIGLGPEDIAGWRQVTVRLNPVMPTDKYATSSRVINEVKAGLRSELSGMEELGIEHPDEEMRRILIERWKKSPQVQQFLTEQALKRAGMRLREPQMTQQRLMEMMPQLPPALQQAIGAWLQGGGAGAGAGSEGGAMGPEVMAAPGVLAVPGEPPAPMGAALASLGAEGAPGAIAPEEPMPRVGPRVRPRGVATGREPGVKRKGMEG